jgi:hypothetical protein
VNASSTDIGLASKHVTFWTAFREQAAERGFRPPSPSSSNWRYLNVGAPGARIVVAVSFRDSYVECKLAIDATRQGASAQARLEALLSDRSAIERELGFADLVWGGQRAATRIYRRRVIDLSQPNECRDAIDWLLETSVRFRAVFGSRLSLSTARGTISELFATLSREHNLYLEKGEFPPGNKTVGMQRLALYSTEVTPIHRYAFAVWWGDETLGSTVTWVLLNPATGDTDGRPRPILTGCRNRAKRWGYGGLIIVNLFAYRSRDPRRLLSVPPEVALGPHNDTIIKKVSSDTAETIAAWGDHGTIVGRDEAVRPLLSNPNCLPKPYATVSGKKQPFYPKGIRLDAPRVPLPA